MHSYRTSAAGRKSAAAHALLLLLHPRHPSEATRDRRLHQRSRMMGTRSHDCIRASVVDGRKEDVSVGSEAEKTELEEVSPSPLERMEQGVGGECRRC